MKIPARNSLWPSLPVLVGFLFFTLSGCAPWWPGPSPDPGDVTVAGDGVLRAPRPLFGDCNSNGVIDLVEVRHKPLGLGEPESFAVSEDPTLHVQADFDGDGDLDLAVAYQYLESVQILFNDGGGSFPVAGRATLTLGSRAKTIAAGDFNNDDLPDLAVARATGTTNEIVVFLNDAGAPGSFPTTQVYAVGDSSAIWTIEAMVAFDLDGGFGTDLAVIANRHGRGSQSDLHILSSTAGGSLAATRHPDLPLSSAASLVAADFDQDDDQDLAIGGGDAVVLARNDGAGSIAVPSGRVYSLSGARQLAAADLNRDGYPELISADTGEGRLLLLPNTTTGETLQFDDAEDSVRVYATPGINSLTVADMDGDGLPDILVDGPALEQASIFLSQGDLRFDPTAYKFEAGVTVSRVLAAELDGVNPPELTALSSTGDRLVVFANKSRISPDCNSNGIPDACDVASGAGHDCNRNRVPDECDVAYQVGLSSRAVWKYFAYNSDWDVRRFETVENAVPLLGPHMYDPALWSAPLDNDPDNELMAMNAWTGEHLRFLFNTDYGDFVVARNPGELSGGSSARLRDYLALDLGIGFWNEKAIAMASGEFSGDSLDDLAVVTLEPIRTDGRDAYVTALKIVEQGRSGLLATWTTSGVIYEQPNPRLPPIRHVIAADLDLDGDQDLLVTPDLISSDLPHDPDLEVAFKIVVLRNDGGGDFHHDPDSDIELDGAVTSIAVEDLNRDGRPEIVVSSHGAPQVTVCRNLSSASGGIDFAHSCRDFAAGSIPLAAKAGDLDGDGFPDIVVANGYSSHISVLHNSPFSAGLDPSADIWQASFDAPESVSVRGTSATANPKDLALVDLDLDGDLDVVTANWASDSVTVLRNAGDGSFLTPLVFVAGFRPEALHVANLDRDERPDIAVANGNGDVTILLNRSRVPRSTDAAADGQPDECGDG